MENPAETEVIAKSYLSGLIIKCGLFFTAGLILTSIILFFCTNQPLGPSYQETFTRLAQLKQEVLYKSILIYFVTMCLVVAGVIFITLIYSHRVVGPMIGLTRILRLIQQGDLTTPAALRSKDAIKPMAESINDMVASHKKILVNLRKNTAELKSITTNSGNKSHDKAIKEKTQSLAAILNGLKL